MITNVENTISRFTVYVVILNFLLLVTILFFVVEPSPYKDNDSLLAGLSIMGTIVTALGFVTGLFFILLAVDAYGEIQQIKKLKEESSQKLKEQDKMLREMADLTYDFLSIQIGMSTKSMDQNKNKKRTIRQRRKFALQNKHLNEKRRINLIKEFKNDGVEEDINTLQSILDDPEESDGIKEVIEEVIRVIESRYI